MKLTASHSVQYFKTIKETLRTEIPISCVIMHLNITHCILYIHILFPSIFRQYSVSFLLCFLIARGQGSHYIFVNKNQICDKCKYAFLFAYRIMYSSLRWLNQQGRDKFIIKTFSIYSHNSVENSKEILFQGGVIWSLKCKKRQTLP